ncbi:MAG TPA: ATP-binding protein [Rhodopila sp.]|nr:ATP-binding protein [Rhodopila sp.]
MAEPASPVRARLTLRSGREDLAAIHPWFESIGERIALPASALFQIQLVLEEAASNAALHGFDAGGVGEIALEVTANPTQVIAVLSDQGRPFDPLTEAPPSPPPRSLDEAAIGGLGIKLMRKFASALRYRRIGPTNELTMIFDLAASSKVLNAGQSLERGAKS